MHRKTKEELTSLYYEVMQMPDSSTKLNDVCRRLERLIAILIEEDEHIELEEDELHSAATDALRFD